MKNKIIFISFFILLFLGGCVSPAYLPQIENTGQNQFGSYIKIFYYPELNKTEIAGELIAVDSTKLMVIDEETRSCISVLIKDIKSFKLRYAKQKHYEWTIPVFTLSTFSHGMFMIFSFPANLIITAIIATAAGNAYRFNQNSITYKEMKMYARFPQGLPSGINVDRIK